MNQEIKEKLESIREAIRNENVSYGEIAELYNLAGYIEEGDIELLEWAEVEE